MAITTTDIKICASALQLVGAEAITSFGDETREARLCASIYPIIKADLLQSHTWRFSIRQEELNRLVATPLFGFAYAYSLPADFLRLVGKNSPTAKHQLYENKVYTDLTPVYAGIQYDVDERFFPAYFEKLVFLEMASLLSSALLEDDGKAKDFGSLAKVQMIKARNIDAQNNTASIIPSGAFNLTNIRY